MQYLSVLIVVFWHIFCVDQSRSENALIFNLRTKSLVDPRHFKQTPSTPPIFTACLASTPAEKLFNEKVSITQNSVFLRDIHKEHENPKYISLDVCNETAKPATVYNSRKDEYSIGYELYYEEGKITMGESEDYESLGPVHTDDNTFSRKLQRDLFATKLNTFRQTKFKLVNGSSTWIFHWIPVLSISSSSNNRKRIYFKDVETVKTTTDHLVDKCEDYNTNTSENVDFFYSEENQIASLKDISTEALESKNDSKNTTLSPESKNDTKNTTLSPESENNTENTTLSPESKNDTINTTLSPESKNDTENTTSSPESKNDTKNTTLPCGNPYGCLEKRQIIPLWYFNSSSAKLASCTGANFVPIWKTIANGQLIKVDQYIYALTRYVINQLKGDGEIFFGVSGILKMNKTINNNESQPQEIHLSDSNNQSFVPVPKIIYRIVHCAVCVWEKAAIIIHNDPTASDSDRLCPESTELKGWEKIQNNNSATGLTYVCRVTRRIDDALGSRSCKNAEFFEAGGLNLNDFPYEWQQDKQEQMQMDYNWIPGKIEQHADVRFRVNKECDTLFDTTYCMPSY
ncbi:uncharacterized protein LOC135843290 [Planococcus citri]|uniref:uncharacterized protein LOC135843290 n=1 Tax=Planococcus citri TaxID=170843 RepID=UPI0031F94345